MCFNCGCQIPDDNMGDEKNITNSTFMHLAKNWKMSEDQAKKKVLKILDEENIEENDDLKSIFESASSAWGQPIEEAMKNTKGLLKKEFRQNK